jgi:hypothetical protein
VARHPFQQLSRERQDEILDLAGFEFMIEDPTAAGLMQCMHRERGLLGELISVELLATMNDFYEQLVVEGQRLGAVRSDMPQRLLVEMVRNLAVTIDQWFISERQSGAGSPAAEEAADLFADLVRRMVALPG